MSQRLVGGFIPPAAPVSTLQGPPPTGDSPELALWNRLLAQPVIPISLAMQSVSKLLFSRPCILTGWSLSTENGNNASLELIDGADLTGGRVGEQTILIVPFLPAVTTDVDVDASSAVAASANNLTLPGLAGATTYITGFEITGDGATAGSIIAITVTGILGGTKTYYLTVPLGLTAAITPLLVEFVRPIPASGLNTAIVVNVPSFGAGNTNAAATAHGFQRTSQEAFFSQLQGTQTQALGAAAVLCRSGLFLRMISGQVSGAVLVRA